MLHLLAVLVPLGLAAAVSPVMLTEQTVLVAAPHGRRNGNMYAAGTILVLALLVGCVVTIGRSLSLPTAPHLDATLDFVIGLLLLALAGALRHGRGSEHERRSPRRHLGAGAAFGFGVLSMATDLTTLAIVVPAAKEISASHAGPGGRLVAGALLVALACLPAWAPPALTSVAPQPVGAALTRIERFINRHGRTTVALLVAAIGVFLVVRGFVRLAAR